VSFIEHDLRPSTDVLSNRPGGERGPELTVDTLVSLRLTIVVVSRPLRIQYAGARYHVMSRGDRREAIYPAITTKVEFEELKNSIAIPSSIPFTAIYVAGDFGYGRDGPGGYFCWRVDERKG
jgi:hypothetical protein